MQNTFFLYGVDIMTGKGLIIDGGPLCTAVMASSAIPSVFAPVEMDGRKLIDGGVLTRIPIDAVRNLGADVVVAVDVLGTADRYGAKKHYIHAGKDNRNNGLGNN
jgi:NTE family protein